MKETIATEIITEIIPKTDTTPEEIKKAFLTFEFDGENTVSISINGTHLGKGYIDKDLGDTLSTIADRWIKIPKEDDDE
jgi:hypothetical protein